jgi:hypothetical protein
MQRIRRHLTYANVAATLALIVAVAGGTTAIAGKTTARKNSVTNKSIRDGNVTAKELAGLTRVSAQTQIVDATAGDGVFATGEAVAHCPQGWRVLTGNGAATGNRVYLQGTGPASIDSWEAGGATDNGGTALVSVTAFCLPRSPASPFKLLP